LTESLGGTFHTVVGDDIPEALLTFARAQHATQLVLGVSSRSRLDRVLGGRGIGATAVDRSGDIDVHMVTHGRSGAGRRPLLPPLDTPSRARQTAGTLQAVLLPALTATALLPLRDDINLASTALLLLVAVFVGALRSAVVGAVLGAAVAALLLNLWFIPPIGQLMIADPDNMLAFSVFALVAVVIAVLAGRARRLAARAVRAGAEAEALADLAHAVVRGDDSVDSLLTRLTQTFGLTSARLLPTAPARSPSATDTRIPVGDGHELALQGRPLAADEQRLLAVYARFLGAALRRPRDGTDGREWPSAREEGHDRPEGLPAGAERDRSPRPSSRAERDTLPGLPEQVEDDPSPEPPAPERRDRPPQSPTLTERVTSPGVSAQVEREVRAALASVTALSAELREMEGRLEAPARWWGGLIDVVDTAVGRLTRLVDSLASHGGTATWTSVSGHGADGTVAVGDLLAVAVRRMREGAGVAVEIRGAPAAPLVLADPVIVERVVDTLLDAAAPRRTPPRRELPYWCRSARRRERAASTCCSAPQSLPPKEA
jgi:K+-sensing histidine kinase KdpD